MLILFWCFVAFVVNYGTMIKILLTESCSYSIFLFGLIVTYHAIAYFKLLYWLNVSVSHWKHVIGNFGKILAWKLCNGIWVSRVFKIDMMLFLKSSQGQFNLLHNQGVQCMRKNQWWIKVLIRAFLSPNSNKVSYIFLIILTKKSPPYHLLDNTF